MQLARRDPVICSIYQSLTRFLGFLLEFLVFALSCFHCLRLQFFGVAIEADEYTPAGKEYSYG